MNLTIPLRRRVKILNLAAVGLAAIVFIGGIYLAVDAFCCSVNHAEASQHEGETGPHHHHHLSFEIRPSHFYKNRISLKIPNGHRLINASPIDAKAISPRHLSLIRNDGDLSLTRGSTSLFILNSSLLI